MNLRCEACERANSDVVEACDNEKEPYRLCAPCHQRLITRSLRPLEWFNLAKRYGPNQFLLHDDFYDEDGIADQPEEEVKDASHFPAPTLAVVSQDAERLLDYSITRWHFEPVVAAEWKALDPRTVLSTVSARFDSTKSFDVRATILSICAAAVRERGADFVRHAWAEYPDNVALDSLAEASSGCLPIAEGFERVVSALDCLQGHEKRDQMFCLSYFHSSKTISWIEQNIFEPITESWGNLAAASDIDWLQVETWLDAGRPLSLVAIDALTAIARPKTPLLREYKPRLTSSPTRSQFREVLHGYRKRDPVPRVDKRIEALLNQTEETTLGLTIG